LLLIPNALTALRDDMCVAPEWLDWTQVEQGQLVFLKHSASAAMGLLYFSLIGGFSAPKIVKVLDTTGYLTSENKDATWRRLNETLYMVVECLQKDGLRVGGEGWMSVLRVRLLHSRVRYRILQKFKGKKKWDTATYGLPINQEDMFATLLSFSTNVLESIDRIAFLGIPHVFRGKNASVLSLQEQNAYLHLWRYIGRLIGVRDEYNMCTNVPASKGAIESVVMHLLHPNDRSQAVANLVLRSVADRPPLMWSFNKHAQAARMLLGENLADALHIPFSWTDRLMLTLVFSGIAFISWCVAPFVVSDGRYVHTCRKALQMQVKSVLAKHQDGSGQGQFSSNITEIET